jgi:hypothetical protein
MISNAVASTGHPQLPSKHLPADGYIIFDSTGDSISGTAGGDDYVGGVFYVTNKSGFFYRLSGPDATNNYYSYVELDSDDFGFNDNFWGAYSGYEPTKTDLGTYSETELSLLYIHDNPYAFDDGDNPSEVFNNENAIEIRSTMTASWQGIGKQFESNNRDVSTGSGTGSAVINYNDEATMASGHVSLLP